MVEKVVTLNDINVAFVRGLIYNSVVGDSGISRHLFNNLKWFESIWSFDEPYRVFNVNGPVIYDIEGIIIVSFLSFGGTIV